MRLGRRLSAAGAPLTLLISLPVIIALAIALMPAPTRTIELDGGMAQVTADRRWTLLPGDCLQLQWRLSEGRSLAVAGVARDGAGSAEFCPQVFAPSPLIAWRGADGVDHVARLDNLHLPDVLVNVICLTLLWAFGIAGLLLLSTNAPERLPNLRAFLTLLLAAAIAILLLRFVSRAMTVEGILSLLKALFLLRGWQVFGALLAAILFIGLAGMALWQGWIGRRRVDALSIFAFLLFIALLYLPFGFGSVPHFEQWIMRAYLEGMPFRLTDAEIVQRPFLMLPGAAGMLLTSESFHGLNLVFALILWGKLTFAYLILRHIGARQWVAFPLALLMLAYPVDIASMSLRSSAIQAHILCFLAAVYLMLRQVQEPARWQILALWLAFALSVGMSENAYGLILLAPLWWWRTAIPASRKINLTAIWYLAPALKAFYMALIWLTGRSFYRSQVVYEGTAFSPDDILPTALGNMVGIYARTFATGWAEAIHTLGIRQWLPLTLLMLSLAGVVAMLLWRMTKNSMHVAPRQSALILALGILFVAPAAIVLAWIPGWGDSLWQPFSLVPLPAAIAVLGALLLLTSRIADAKWRDLTLMALCLLLLLPAISRLVNQQAYYVKSANNKAHLLSQVLQIAPVMADETRIIILSDMPADERQALLVDELKAGVVGPALYLLTEDGVDRRGWFCHSIPECRALRHWLDELPHTLVFMLDAELNVTLLHEPGDRLEAFAGVEYDAARLYDADAPLPKRAFTMLGATSP